MPAMYSAIAGIDHVAAEYVWHNGCLQLTLCAETVGF